LNYIRKNVAQTHRNKIETKKKKWKRSHTQARNLDCLCHAREEKKGKEVMVQALRLASQGIPTRVKKLKERPAEGKKLCPRSCKHVWGQRDSMAENAVRVKRAKSAEEER